LNAIVTINPADFDRINSETASVAFMQELLWAEAYRIGLLNNDGGVLLPAKDTMYRCPYDKRRAYGHQYIVSFFANFSEAGHDEGLLLPGKDTIHRVLLRQEWPIWGC